MTICISLHPPRKKTQHHMCGWFLFPFPPRHLGLEHYKDLLCPKWPGLDRAKSSVQKGKPLGGSVRRTRMVGPRGVEEGILSSPLFWVPNRSENQDFFGLLTQIPDHHSRLKTHHDAGKVDLKPANLNLTLHQHGTFMGNSKWSAVRPRGLHVSTVGR